MTPEPPYRQYRPKAEGGVSGSYVEYLDRIERERYDLLSQVSAVLDLLDSPHYVPLYVNKDAAQVIRSILRGPNQNAPEDS